MILAATGHRPDKIGLSYDLDRLREFARRELQSLKPDALISGLARGWDTAVALAAVDLRIDLIVSIPFEGQQDRWPTADQGRYGMLRGCAREEHVMSREPRTEAYRQRDYWMVDRGSAVLALFNGSPGGTKMTVDYAESRDRAVLNLWSAWIRFASCDSRGT